jgi:hypothetical protein
MACGSLGAAAYNKAFSLEYPPQFVAGDILFTRIELLIAGHDETVIALESGGTRDEVCIMPVDQLANRLDVLWRHFVISFI